MQMMNKNDSQDS